MKEPHESKSPIDTMIEEAMIDDIPPHIQGELHGYVGKWFKLINNDFVDIPKSIAEMKTSYTQKMVVFFAILVAGAICMSLAQSSGTAAMGCFMAVTGISGIMALSTASHTQLCLLRILKEIRIQRRMERERVNPGESTDRAASPGVE